MPNIELSVKLFYPDAQIPYQKYLDDAGVDLFSYHELVIQPHDTIKLDCGIAIDIPVGYFGLITPRSSWRAKGLLCQSIFDAGFQGLIEPFTTNLSSNPVSILKGERVLQLVILPIPVSKTCSIVEDFNPSLRGSNGVGSTGKF